MQRESTVPGGRAKVVDQRATELFGRALETAGSASVAAKGVSEAAGDLAEDELASLKKYCFAIQRSLMTRFLSHRPP